MDNNETLSLEKNALSHGQTCDNAVLYSSPHSEPKPLAGIRAFTYI